MTSAIRLKYLADSPHDMVEPSSRGPRVTHYSIPNIDSIGTGLREDSETIESSKLIVEEDDILVSKLNPHKPRIVKVQKSPLPIVASSEFVVLRDPRVDRGYLRYFLNSRHATDDLISRMRSVTRSHQRAQPDDILNLELPDMPLATQRKVAGFLDRETERIDALVDKKRRLIDLLEEKRTATITQAVTKGLNPTVPMKPSNIPWIGMVPEHWDMTTIKRVSTVQYGLGQPPPESDVGIPIIRATNINRGEIATNNLLHAEIADLPLDRAPLLEEGEILVVRSGALTGDSAIVTSEWAGSAPGYDLRLTPNSMNSEFMAWFLLSTSGLEQMWLASSRAAQPHLNADELGEVSISSPPQSEQAEIALCVNDFTSTSSRLADTLTTQLSLLAEYREALITAAVTGEIDVDTFESNQHREEAPA